MLETMRSQTRSSLSSPKKNDSKVILAEIESMKEYFKNNDKMSAMSNNMQQINRRHDEMVKIMTSTLPSSVDKLKNDSTKINKLYADFAQLYQNLNDSVIAMPSPTPIKKRKMSMFGGGDHETVKVIKDLIISQIAQSKKEFVAHVDNGIASKMDKLLQELNSRNVMLFNNLKTINDAQSQHIIQQNDVNNVKQIKAHESVLKVHLQTIAEKIGKLNQTQIGMNRTMALMQSQPIMPSKTNDNDKGNKGKYYELQRILPQIQQIVSQNVMDSNKSIIAKVESMMERFVETKEDKDVMNDIMKEIVLLKNLCNDIHKKSEQFPHFVARNKDLKKLEQTVLAASKSIKQLQVQPKPKQSGMELEIMRMQMMKFGNWCENILSQISNHRNDCSIYVIIYTLAQIAFSTFAYDNENDEEDAELTKRVLSDIQSRALVILDQIERESEHAELDKHAVIETVIEWMQRVLGDEEEQNGKIWIARTGHAMAHFCNRELSVNGKLNGMKHRLEQIMSTQSKTCLKMSIFQPLIGVCSVSLVLFCLWLQALTREQNDFW